jgi:hypothetical protein
MLGLATMAARLAEKRTGYGPFQGEWENFAEYMEPRRHLRRWKPYEVAFSREYYQIIDRITRGEKP